MAVALVLADSPYPSITLAAKSKAMKEQAVIPKEQLGCVSCPSLMLTSKHLADSWGAPSKRKMQAKQALPGIASHVNDLRVAQSAIMECSLPTEFHERQEGSSNLANVVAARRLHGLWDVSSPRLTITSPGELLDVRCKRNKRATHFLK